MSKSLRFQIHHERKNAYDARKQRRKMCKKNKTTEKKILSKNQKVLNFFAVRERTEFN